MDTLFRIHGHIARIDLNESDDEINCELCGVVVP